ncbi:hypothetical protein QFC21_002296 [Naganishia friedmannii]|uniref:Uncharacterized protein n=1 Tax=Naganishia friedmannii TaxID=89922 RepID=A0ACC2VXQ7_9TREE|nr:hypothetical protein QFC21_002296 [Naganishia friedmannii]
MYKKAFDGFGIQASIILNFPADKKVYVIGPKGIEDELRGVGISFTGGTDPDDRVFVPSGDYSSIKNDPSIGAVLCGGDHFINYKKYAKAHTCIMNNPGCEFIITNGDESYPVAGGTLPAVSAPIRVSTNRTPTIIGKPSPHMMNCILADHDLDPERTIMVGDNLDTDILFGINSNIATLLVMTGVATESQLTGGQKSVIVPDYIVQSMGDFAVLADER